MEWWESLALYSSPCSRHWHGEVGLLVTSLRKFTRESGQSGGRGAGWQCVHEGRFNRAPAG